MPFLENTKNQVDFAFKNMRGPCIKCKHYEGPGVTAPYEEHYCLKNESPCGDFRQNGACGIIGVYFAPKN
jgi:hypothetical protein